jgi:uncharacterized protein (DUF488 family)
MPMSLQLFTIGFTKKSAEQFFSKLQQAGVKRVVDVRLHNNSQLAGFTKRDDLEYFLRAIAGIEYVHIPDLAPSPELFDRYKRGGQAWTEYEAEFLSLMKQRKIEKTVPRKLLDGSCLLCSEDKPDHCHRRLIAEYLRDRWENVEITHIT